MRVCPVAGVQWNGAAHSLTTGLLYVNAIDWCTVFKAGPDPKWVATVPYTGLANGWGTNDPINKWSGWINAVESANRQDGVARPHAGADVRGAHADRGQRPVHGRSQRQFSCAQLAQRQELYRFDTGGPIAGGIVTYEQKGKQYVAVASGSSGGSIPLTGSTTIVIFGQ